MARVLGATAPTCLAFLLLLIAMCSQKTCAAPWRGADDDIGIPSPDDWKGTAFVPQGKLRGLLGALSVQSRVPEPGVDARAPSGVEWDPASQLSSRTEAPATRMVPEKQKEAPKRGKYLQTLPPLLMKIMKDNAREIGGQPVHRITFQNGRVHTLPVALVEEEAVHTTATPAPGVVGEGHANAAEDNFVVKYCLGFGAAVLVTMLIAMFSCYRLIRQRRQINQRLAEAAEAERIARSYTSRLDRRLARLKALDRKTQHQQPVPLQ